MILARLLVAPEILPEICGMMPSTIRIVGSDDTRMNGSVALVLDVTATGVPGGEWQGVVQIDGASKTITFGPRA